MLRLQMGGGGYQTCQSWQRQLHTRRLDPPTSFLPLLPPQSYGLCKNRGALKAGEAVLKVAATEA